MRKSIFIPVAAVWLGGMATAAGAHNNNHHHHEAAYHNLKRQTETTSTDIVAPVLPILSLPTITQAPVINCGRLRLDLLANSPSPPSALANTQTNQPNDENFVATQFCSTAWQVNAVKTATAPKFAAYTSAQKSYQSAIRSSAHSIYSACITMEGAMVPAINALFLAATDYNECTSAFAKWAEASHVTLVPDATDTRFVSQMTGATNGLAGTENVSGQLASSTSTAGAARETRAVMVAAAVAVVVVARAVL
ncbi:hypothetical protein QBC35DRAFT_455871 [Podospora australis]|uniref:Infection structure specific protein n=1 Tax=Podospora australis TaxID=1536484 RepID=A0AAN7AFE9_9PEZI|nr:hypothetical protein QBC35DRAFT_455871 [Podospora australis]